MLELKNLTITTHKNRVLLKNFSFVLNNNDKIAIIGEEGNGKSTLLQAIVDINLVKDYVNVEGHINKNNARCGYLTQSMNPIWNDCDVFEFLIKESPKDEISIEQYNQMNELTRCLTEVDLDVNYLMDTKLIKTCSGGEKVKLQLAKLLYQNPDFLLLDEPTNDLDLRTLIWLEEFIKNQSRPILFISHDETLLENCANGIIHLEQLKRKTESSWTVEHIGYTDYCEKRNYNIDRTNRIASKEKAEYNKQLERYRKLYQRVDHELNSVSRQNPHGGQLLKKKMKSVKSLGKRLENKELSSKIEPEEAIELFFDDVRIHANKIILDYHLDLLMMKERVLCNDINLHVKGNEHIVIIGQNGIGKTTLIKKLMETLRNRHDIKVGYCPQNYGELLPMKETPINFLLSNLEYTMKSKVQTYLGSLKFTAEEMEHPMENLSYGQRCKILLVYLVIHQFDVLILDEPTRNMSALSTPVLRKIFRDFKGCIISISHDRKFIDEVCDTVYEMKDGQFLKLD
ncbi:MAG: ATP-binding cassette domain-containing protein [Anaerorhabdus sp.]|uniref:ATP-binding cassette domain-containing protein n=1 Tax=Anaerorhabdus sp. TaxID=1872524 RepID=UPI002FC93249